jgi:hypothetical protein
MPFQARHTYLHTISKIYRVNNFCQLSAHTKPNLGVYGPAETLPSKVMSVCALKCFTMSIAVQLCIFGCRSSVSGEKKGSIM